MSSEKPAVPLIRERMRVPFLGRTYHYDYGYPWPVAIWAEVCWRIEQGIPYRGGDGGLMGYVSRWAYVQNKKAERKGAAHAR